MISGPLLTHLDKSWKGWALPAWTLRSLHYFDGIDAGDAITACGLAFDPEKLFLPGAWRRRCARCEAVLARSP